LILVDTNIVLDIATRDPIWSEWSLGQLETAAASGVIAINDVVYAELAAGYQHPDSLDHAIATLNLAHAPIPKFALFLAGQAFRKYRRQQGTKLNVLPDFFIGAHAMVAGAPLLTRDAQRIRACFPSVILLSP